eukprot:6196051-Pleurochrysis_carterae.AAC.1
MPILHATRTTRSGRLLLAFAVRSRSLAGAVASCHRAYLGPPAVLKMRSEMTIVGEMLAARRVAELNRHGQSGCHRNDDRAHRGHNGGSPDQHARPKIIIADKLRHQPGESGFLRPQRRRAHDYARRVDRSVTV